MKQTVVLVIALIICLVPILLMADDDIIVEKGDKKITIKSGGDLQDLEMLKKLQLNMTTGVPKDEAADAPFFGIYPSDLDFPKAQSLDYPNNYGILITGVVPNSPAYEYRLAEDDIIMEIDGKKALNLKEFDKVKAIYRAGDPVVLTIFRNGEIKKINFVFGSRVKPKMPGTGEQHQQKKGKLSPGSGGGTWIPMFFTSDIDDVNELIEAIGFSKLPEDGILTQGFGGKGNIGNGWFLGGQFNFYGDKKKVKVEDYVNDMSYNMFIGGATLDKRIPITKNIVTSLGLMIGGASHKIDLVHSNGDYNWPIPNPDDPPTTETVMDGNSSSTISKGYILVQPRAELMVRLLSWLSLRGEVGYMYGYGPTSGWKVKHAEGDTYELQNSPDSPFEGLTFTVGPWFGF